MQHNIDADCIKRKDDQAVFRLLQNAGAYALHVTIQRRAASLIASQFSAPSRNLAISGPSRFEKSSLQAIFA
jgi:hypothetical protein